MLSPREHMDLALKASVVPLLRDSGFTGTYPHFRRLRTTHVELLTFHFDINGGGFLVEIARGGIGGVTTHLGNHIQASKIKSWDLPPSDRLRLKPREGSSTDSWFRYESGSYDSVAQEVLAVLPLAHDFWSQRAAQLGR